MTFKDSLLAKSNQRSKTYKSVCFKKLVPNALFHNLYAGILWFVVKNLTALCVSVPSSPFEPNGCRMKLKVTVGYDPQNRGLEGPWVTIGTCSTQYNYPISRIIFSPCSTLRAQVFSTWQGFHSILFCFDSPFRKLSFILSPNPSLFNFDPNATI